jgi:hypothetical protein
MSRQVAVLLEVSAKRSFVSAADWPGWSRGAKTADEALASLLAYAPRYGAVAKAARVRFAVPTKLQELHVIERLRGGASTDFGVPGEEGKADERALDAKELGRQVRILKASWKALDDAARRAKGVTLATGPRGGGRSLAKIVQHVTEAEGAYLSKLGSRPPREQPVPATWRALILDAVRARARGEGPPNPNNTRTRWTPRYFLRRAAWHVLDHAWEIEDRSSGGTD